MPWGLAAERSFDLLLGENRDLSEGLTVPGAASAGRHSRFSPLFLQQRARDLVRELQGSNSAKCNTEVISGQSAPESSRLLEHRDSSVFLRALRFSSPCSAHLIPSVQTETSTAGGCFVPSLSPESWGLTLRETRRALPFQLPRLTQERGCICLLPGCFLR